MSDEIKQKAYKQYINDTVRRVQQFGPVIAVGELVSMLLDYRSGFFAAHEANSLNLVAEIILIAVSTLVFLFFTFVCRKKEISTRLKEFVLIFFRAACILAVLMFISTDIGVRHRALGAYIILLFILQMTPAYRPILNWIQFIIIGAVTTFEYYLFVSQNLNTLYTTLVVFFCFAMSTAYLRRYFLKQLENKLAVEESNEKFQNLVNHTVVSLAGAIEAKDHYTKGHSQRVAEYSRMIAEKLGYDAQKLKSIYFIALMHDVGKIGVPDTVINKTGRLTDEEFAEIRKHPAMGDEILKGITEMPGIREGARWHHERYDGRGYPDGLAGDQIPEISRIIAVADAYDAMTSNRSYRKLLPQEVVRKQIADNMGTQFDPKMAQIMLDLIDADKDYTMHE